MAQLIYDSVSSYFANELGTIHVSPEQKQATEEFLSTAAVACLVVRRDDRSPNALSFACSGQLQGSSGDALVFIKSTHGPSHQLFFGSPPPYQSEASAINDTQLIANLREKLEDSFSSGTGLLNVLSMMRKYSKLDTVMGAMKKERSTLLVKTLDWAEACVTADHYQPRSDDIVDKIAAIRTREGKIKAVIKVTDTLCSDVEGYAVCKKSLEQIARELGEESHKLFKEWCAKCANVTLDKRLQCIEIDAQSQVPIVTFDPKLVKLSRDCRQLRTIAFNIPESIAAKEADAFRYGTIARELKEIVNFYCTVGDQILTSQKPMLIDAATAFTVLLESRDRISWDKEPSKLRSWLDQLREFAKKFSSENRYLRQRHQNVLTILVPLFDSTPSKWRLSLAEATTIVREVDTKYNHTLPWKRHWDHQLYKLLEYHFNDALLRSEGWLGFGSHGLTAAPPQTSYGSRPSTAMSVSSAGGASEPFRVDLCFAAGCVALRPPLEEIQAKIYLRIKKFLMTPQNFRGFVEVPEGQEPIFGAIYLRSFFSFPLLYSKATEIVRELENVISSFREWTSLYYVMQAYGNSFQAMSEYLHLDTLDNYKDNLALLKARTQKFNRLYLDNEIKCESAHIVINIIPIKTFVDWLLSEMDKLLVRTLREKTDFDARELSSEMAILLEKVSKPPIRIGEYMELESILRTELTAKYLTWKDKFEDISSKATFLRKWAASLAPNITDLNSKYDELAGVVESKESLLESYRDMVKAKTESAVSNLANEMNSLVLRWKRTSPATREGPEFVAEFKQEVDALVKDFEEVSTACGHFGLERPASFEDFHELVSEVSAMDDKLNLIGEFEAGIKNYIEMEWIVSRNKLAAIEQHLNSWQENHANSGPVLEARISEWRELVQILKLCRGECFAKTHWIEFLAILGLGHGITYENMTLGHLLKKRHVLKSSKEALKELNSKAMGETSVRETFSELDTFAATAKLSLFDYTTADGKDIKLIKDWRTILNQISESILTLGSLKGSEFYSNEFAEKGSQWESRLNQLDKVINLLNSVQRKWTYLEPIYAKNSSGPGVFTDHSFASSSRDFIETMKTIASDSHVVRLLRIPNLEPKLSDMDKVLVSCQKKLSVFMEDSRNRFPRFYFLADEDLLLVLAGKVEISAAGLLKKLFNNNIVKLHFEGKSVTAIESSEGEVVTLAETVSTTTDQVESWLRALEVQVKGTLKKNLFEALSSGKGTLQNPEWTLPSQILSLIQWIIFTKKTEEAISRSKLDDIKTEFGKQLTLLTSQKTDEAEFDAVLKIKVKSLVLDTIHFLAVVEELAESNVRSIEDWVWQKQLRYYVATAGQGGSKERTLSVTMGTSKQLYSFEYLGCYGSAKLVHTPLTDKCYLTCMQAMSMGLGGNPYGPAGTGKTETVKALGQQLGRQVLVFNCDEAIDVKAMTRILVGLIKCGSWGCFDEFNRLTMDVLSALSSQIAAIQVTLKASGPSVQLPEFGEVTVDHNSAIFITLNPMGKKYKGRNRLPDNLKALFLPVAMTVPDNVIISRVLLLAEGFDINLSGTLGEKLASWFELAANVMQPQNHYDWGLRAIKTALNSSGRALRESPGRDQTALLVDALRKQVKSKLVGDDPQRFEDLVTDVFGSGFLEDEESGQANEKLRLALVDAMNSRELVPDDNLVAKALELDEQLKSRLGVVILGETGVGKSTVWKMLATARKAAMRQNVRPVVISPKSIPRQRLLGYIDEETREWHDGLLPCKARDIARGEDFDEDDGERPMTQATLDTFHWLIFDGDIDPEWVEALNSVLDDNKVLTLPSGERIDFDSQRMNIIFEVTSLKFASPATISRLGVLSVSGSKCDHVIRGALNRMNAQQITVQEITSILPPSDEASITMSTANTFLAQLAFANCQYSTAVQRFTRRSTSNSSRAFKTGALVVTAAVGQTIDFLSPWTENVQQEDRVKGSSSSALVVVGPSGVGKHAILSETVLKTGLVVTVYCCPETSPLEIMSKIRQVATVTSSAASKVMRSSNGGKLIVFLRNLELIQADKWGSKSVMAFLVSLLSHGGFYDETTFEWTQLQNYQVVATATSTEVLDPRLISLSHVVQVTLPPADELIAIIDLLCPDGAPWKQHFSKTFVRTVQEIGSRSSDYTSNTIRSAVEAIRSLCRVEEVTNEVLYAETQRTLARFSREAPTLLQRSLMSTFGSIDSDKLLRVLSYGSKVSFAPAANYREWLTKSLISWINETESYQPEIGLVSETVELFAQVGIFLSDSTPGISGLALLGHSGCGRKLALRVLSHIFGYDTVWSPRSKLNEKQLATELKSFVDGASDDDGSDKKVLIILDQVHFELLPFLRKFMYTFSREYNGQATVKIAIVASSLDETSSLMWNRVASIVNIEPMCEVSLEMLPTLLAKSSIEQKFAQNFPKVLRLFPQYENDTRRYLAFVHAYVELVTVKRRQLDERRKTLSVGVTKLNEASSEVEQLKTAAAEQSKILANKRQEADDALTMITNSMEGAEDQKVELEDVKSRTERETSKLKIRKVEIDKELALIEPTIQAAKAAVGGIKSEALSEIRSLRAPPEVIRDILEGVIRLMGVNDTSWISMKSFLARRGVKDEIINFDARKITVDMREKVEQLLEVRPNSFDAAVAKRASTAAAPLASWVMANLSFAKVLHKIKPLEDEQNRLESGLRSAQTRMKSLSSQLEGVESTVGDLRTRLNHVTVEAAQIEVGLKQTTQVLEQSEALVGELSGEFQRWKQQLKELEAKSEQLALNCVIAAAYVTLMGPLDSDDRRQELIKNCCQMLGLSGGLDIVEFLDCSSEEEALLSRAASSPFLAPLVLDPAHKLMVSVPKVEATDMSNRDWLRVVELGLRFGRTVLVEDFTKMDVALLAIVRREVFGVEGSRFWTLLGDKRVDYNPSFKLYFASNGQVENLQNNRLFNVINLCPSDSSTSASLLSMVIEVRAPELETKKVQLEVDKRKLEARLRDLEQQLLEKLVNSRGNLLDDRQLIESLKETKKSSKEVEASLQMSAQVGADLDNQRAQYSDLANFASKLYFALGELRQLNRMYSYGLREYEELFKRALRSERNLSQRSLLQRVYSYAAWGLFPEEKQMFKLFCEKRFSAEAATLQLDDGVSMRTFFKDIETSGLKLILVMASPGSDPTAEIREIASELRIDKDMKVISLGGNVLYEAEQAVQSKSHLILSNLHLVIGWLSRLSKLVADAKSSSGNNERYVILISECHDDFPTQLLEMSTKFAYESPPGLIAHVNRLTFDPQIKTNNELNRLAHLHAVCCERRHFVPQGWTKSYEFGFVDFRSAASTIAEVKSSKERRHQMDFICGLLGTVIYGGKLDTRVDFNVLQATIANWFTEDKGLKSIGDSNEAAALGLAANVSKWKEALTEERIARGLRILDKATTSTAMVREELRKLRQLWDQLAVPKTSDGRRPATSASRTGNPISELLISELSLAVRLAAMIDEDLRSPKSVETQRSLAANETPDRWLTLFESGPDRADLFMRAVADITKELSRMSNYSTPTSYNLSHFLRPASALNALRQQASRQLKVTIDWLQLHTSWPPRDPPRSSSASVVSIEGLLIEGALYEDGVLKECRQDSSLQMAMPTLAAYFVSKDSAQKNDSDVIALPLYCSAARESLVTWLDVPCKADTRAVWVQRSVALVLRE